MDVVSVKNNLKGFNYALRRRIPSKNAFFSFIRVIFIKYVYDNFETNEKRESLKHYIDNYGVGSKGELLGWVADTLVELDEKYGLDGILKRQNKAYEEDYALIEAIKEVEPLLKGLDSLSLKDNDNGEVSRNLIEFLFDCAEEGGRLTAENCTSRVLSNVAKELLDPKDGDTFCDFAAGIGLSTLQIVGKKQIQTLQFDIDENANGISAMLHIIAGRGNAPGNRFLIREGDYLNGHKHFPEVFDKVFVDTPINGIETARLGLERAEELLDRNGCAVVIVHPSILVAETGLAFETKEQLIKKAVVKAVIKLPSERLGTTVAPIMIVLSKECWHDEVVFVDATKSPEEQLDPQKISKRESAKISLDDYIKDIVAAVNNKENRKGFSVVVPRSEIKGFTLAPSYYLRNDNNTDDVSLEEIDSKIAELFMQLSLLNEGI